MSITRQLNLLDGLRLEIPHLRSLESSVVHDIETISGRLLGGGKAWVVSGFAIPTSGIGRHHSELMLDVSGGMICHYLASERGTVLAVPTDRTADPLNETNERVVGAFVAGGINYIGLDLTRSVDPDSAVTATFQDTQTGEKFSRIVPSARVLDYQIVISPQVFGASPNLLPIARVETDLAGRVVRVWDCRPMLFGLSGGGDAYEPARPYTWHGGRLAPEIETSSPDKDPFHTSDKRLASAKEWSDAVMTRLWELGGGEWWGAPTSDRDVKIAYAMTDRMGVYLDYSNQTSEFTVGVSLASDSGARGTVKAIIDRGTTGTLVLSGVTGDFVVGQSITDENGGAAKVASKPVTCDDNWLFYSTEGEYYCHWTGVSVLFANSTATYNKIRDSAETYGATGVPFPDGYVLYVDVDRNAEGAEIVPALKPASVLGQPATPGSRFILAWRNGDRLFARDLPFSVGRPTQIPIASANQFGTVRLYDRDHEPWNPDTPEVLGTNLFNVPDGIPTLDSTGRRISKAIDGPEHGWHVPGPLYVAGPTQFDRVAANEITAYDFRLPESRMRRFWEHPTPLFISEPGHLITREPTGLKVALISHTEQPLTEFFFSVPMPREGVYVSQVLVYVGAINPEKVLPLTLEVSVYGLCGIGEMLKIKTETYQIEAESHDLLYPPAPASSDFEPIAFDLTEKLYAPGKASPLYGYVVGFKLSGSKDAAFKVMRIGSAYQYQELTEI